MVVESTIASFGNLLPHVLDFVPVKVSLIVSLNASRKNKTPATIRIIDHTFFAVIILPLGLVAHQLPHLKQNYYTGE